MTPLTAPPPGDFLPPGLVHLLGIARQVIDEHVNDEGRCLACGSGWPCQQALLAEFALGAV